MARHRNWAEARRKVTDAGRCRVCRTGQPPIDAAHVIARSLAPNGGEHADAIVELCRECHNKFDSHQLDLLPYLSLAEQLSAVTVAGGIEAARRQITGRRND
jgi:5-methylcytosine-specific restriction endonuclease McrA